MTVKKLSSDTLRTHKGISFVGISTCFIVYDGAGHFFMAQRSKKARDEHGTWEIGGGGLKWGQKAEDNLKREVKEEYNVTPKQIDFLGYRDVLRTQNGQPTHWLALDFAVLADPSQVKINEPEMFDDAGWFSLEKLPSPLHSQQKPYFKKYKQQLKQFLKP